MLRKGEGNPNNWQLAVKDGRVTLFLDEGDDDGVSGDTALLTGGWYHLAGTWDDSTAKVYVDGVLDNAGEARAGPIGTDTRPLYIGGRIGTLDLIEGGLDDIRFYDRALNRTEIRLIYEEGKSGDFDPQLIASYRFDDAAPEPHLLGHWRLEDSGGGGMSAIVNVTIKNNGRIDSYNSSLGHYDLSNATGEAAVSTNRTSSASLDVDTSVTCPHE